MQIIVERSPANSPGPDVIDELLTSAPVGVARGRRQIDYFCSSRDFPACRTTSKEFIDTYKIANITEAQRKWRGMTRYWSLTLTIDPRGTFFSVDTRLTIEKEL